MCGAALLPAIAEGNVTIMIIFFKQNLNHLWRPPATPSSGPYKGTPSVFFSRHKAFQKNFQFFPKKAILSKSKVN